MLAAGSPGSASFGDTPVIHTLQPLPLPPTSREERPLHCTPPARLSARRFCVLFPSQPRGNRSGAGRDELTPPPARPPTLTRSRCRAACAWRGEWRDGPGPGPGEARPARAPCRGGLRRSPGGGGCRLWAQGRGWGLPTPEEEGLIAIRPPFLRPSPLPEICPRAGGCGRGDCGGHSPRPLPGRRSLEMLWDRPLPGQCPPLTQAAFASPHLRLPEWGCPPTSPPCSSRDTLTRYCSSSLPPQGPGQALPTLVPFGTNTTVSTGKAAGA